MNPDERRRLENLEREMREHYHNGVVGREISFRDIVDGIEVVSAAPTNTPKRVGEQIKIYTNGATLRLYWYDTTAAVWHYVTATA